jgi:hypothetical protein
VATDHKGQTSMSGHYNSRNVLTVAGAVFLTISSVTWAVVVSDLYVPKPPATEFTVTEHCVRSATARDSIFCSEWLKKFPAQSVKL